MRYYFNDILKKKFSLCISHSYFGDMLFFSCRLQQTHTQREQFQCFILIHRDTLTMKWAIPGLPKTLGIAMLSKNSEQVPSSSTVTPGFIPTTTLLSPLVRKTIPSPSGYTLQVPSPGAVRCGAIGGRTKEEPVLIFFREYPGLCTIILGQRR